MLTSRRILTVLLLALALVAASIASASASTTTWRSCGSVSATVNEGLNRATAKVFAITQDGKPRLSCTTARSLTRRVLKFGPGQTCALAAGRGR
jgi:hypothetical protein